jgi:membrane protease YdiL (CAAX protease family)
LKRQRGRQRKPSFFQRHSLSLVSIAILVLWIVLYSHGNEKTHLGSFFGNAIADWTGVVVMVLATKRFYERGSQESKQPSRTLSNRVAETVREHSLTIFLVITGIGWAILFAKLDSESKWGEVAGNVVSEWTQLIGIVLMTKELVEIGSKESRD